MCLKSFTREKDRNRHESSHTGSKPYICKGKLKNSEWGCGRSFARSDGLKAHHKTRKGQKCIEPLLGDEAMLQDQEPREGGAEGDMQSASSTSPSGRKERCTLVLETTKQSIPISSHSLENHNALSRRAIDLIDDKVLKPLLEDFVMPSFHSLVVTQ